MKTVISTPTTPPAIATVGAAYSSQRIALHWVSAVIILWAMMTGFVVSLLPAGAESKAWVGWVNVSLTTLLIPLFVWRCIIAYFAHGRRCGGKPTLASAAHLALYLATLVVLASGVLMMKRPIVVFDWFSFPPPLQATEATAFFYRVHLWACALQAALVALHIAAVIKHALVGQPVHKRMWFSR